jgi:lysylphosphatidylglycerol synthetase-like protein (DUF2156 family)
MKEKIPDINYFDDLEQAVFNRIEGYKKRQQRRKKIRQTLVVPMLIMLIGLGGWVYFYPSQNKIPSQNEHLTAVNLLESIDVDESDMYAVLQENSQVATSATDDEFLYYLAEDDAVEYDLMSSK